MTKIIKDEPNKQIDPSMSDLQEMVRTTVVNASDRSPQWTETKYEGAHMNYGEPNATVKGKRNEPKTTVHSEETLQGGVYAPGQPMKE
jgi:hypothetical protein